MTVPYLTRYTGSSVFKLTSPAQYRSSPRLTATPCEVACTARFRARFRARLAAATTIMIMTVLGLPAVAIGQSPARQPAATPQIQAPGDARAALSTQNAFQQSAAQQSAAQQAAAQAAAQASDQALAQVQTSLQPPARTPEQTQDLLRSRMVPPPPSVLPQPQTLPAANANDQANDQVSAPNPFAPAAQSAPRPTDASAPPVSVAPSVRPLPPLPTVTGEVPAVEDDYLGMTPAQIVHLRKMLDDRQRAAAELPDPPKAQTGSIRVGLAPGSTPPPIRTFVNSVSSFVVVDRTGAPWPVENFRVGNAALFRVNRLDQGQGSAFTIQTMSMYGSSDLVLKLAGSPTPVVLMLLAGQKQFDARLEVRVDGTGPNAMLNAAAVPSGTDARLLPILDGVPPPSGTRLKTDGLDGFDAWLMPNHRMIVRSPVRIVKPATIEFVSSSDGTYVYSLAPATHLLGVANGVFVDIAVSGW